MVVSVVRKKIIGQIEFILSRTTSCICPFFCIEHLYGRFPLYLFYDFFSYDRHDRYDRYNDMETRLKCPDYVLKEDRNARSGDFIVNS